MQFVAKTWGRALMITCASDSGWRHFFSQQGVCPRLLRDPRLLFHLSRRNSQSCYIALPVRHYRIGIHPCGPGVQACRIHGSNFTLPRHLNMVRQASTILLM